TSPRPIAVYSGKIDEGTAPRFRASRWISFRACAFASPSPKTASRTRLSIRCAITTANYSCAPPPFTFDQCWCRGGLQAALGGLKPAATPHVTADLFDQEHHVERLLHRAVGTQLAKLSAGEALAAQNQDRQVLHAELATQLADHLISRHAGHIFVEEDQRRPSLPCGVDRLGSGFRRHSMEAELLEEAAHQHENRTVVVNDENDRFFVHCTATVSAVCSVRQICAR